MNIKTIFSSIAKLIRKLVPNKQLIAAIEYATQAAVQFVDNEERRAWVKKQLIEKFHIPGYIANLTVEMAVAHLKAEAVKTAEKAAGALPHP